MIEKLERGESGLVITHAQIQEKVEAIAHILEARYRNWFTLLCILKGGHPFFNDVRVRLDQLGVRYMDAQVGIKAYKDETGHERALLYGPPSSHLFYNRNVVVLDDFIETGHTIRWLLNFLTRPHHRPSRVTFGALLVKSAGIPAFVDQELSGFHIPADNPPLIGYGLDYNEAYRDLDAIRELTPEDRAKVDNKTDSRD